MLILSPSNKVINTDLLTEHSDEFNYGVLSFKDYKNPDFYFDRKIEYLEEFASASITLRIGQFETVMPMHWSILCTDLEYVQTVPLQEVSARDFTVFCLNPIDGYKPEYEILKTGMIFPQTTWTCPPIADKDMLVVPLGKQDVSPDSDVTRGPLCAIFSPNKIEVYKEISEIW